MNNWQTKNMRDIEKTKETRKRILEIMYDNRSDGLFLTEKLREKLPGLTEEEIHREVIYLEGKHLLEIKSKYMGKEFLNFAGLKITSHGIDLVEDPESFNKLFSITMNNIGSILDSNVNINSYNNTQIINKLIQDDKELQEKLKELRVATDEKDKSKIMDILKYIGDKSVDVLIAIVLGKVRL